MNLVAFVVPKKFSISLPQDLIPEGKVADDVTYFSFTNYEHELSQGETPPTNAIETEIIFNEKKLDLILQARLKQAEKYEERVVRRGDLTIDDREAVRIWYEGGGWNFPNEISSYIRYGELQTVVISSYYDPRNPTAIDTIQRIHWSFRRLDI